MFHKTVSDVVMTHKMDMITNSKNCEYLIVPEIPPRSLGCAQGLCSKGAYVTETFALNRFSEKS